MAPRQRLARSPGTTPLKLARARELRRQATPAERRLWAAVRHNRLSGFHFRRQHVLEGYIVDFCCIKARVVVEIDGAHHADQADADAQRDAVLRRLGFRILRFTNTDVLDHLPKVLAVVNAMCHALPTSRPVSE